MRDRVKLGLPIVASAAFLFGHAYADGMPAATPAAAPADNACMAIADAKFQQWRQERLLIQEAKTFADNSTKNDEMILTSNTAYWNRLGVWETGNITRGERAARSPDRILRIMGLIDCAKGGSDQTMGQPATLYTYHYVPDRNGFSAEGRIWISDATGLPLRQELKETAPPANARVATTVSTTYRYNADVKVPGSAELAEDMRLRLQGLTFASPGASFPAH